MDLDSTQRGYVIQRATEGATLNQICQELGIARQTLWHYRMSNPSFDTVVARALDEGIEAQTDELLTLHEKERDPQRLGRRSENIKWIASRRKRAAYGDAVSIDVTERIDIKGSLLEARKRSGVPVCDQSDTDDTQALEQAEYSVIEPNGSEPCADSGDGEEVDIFS